MKLVTHNLSGLEPKLIKLEFIIYLPKLKVLRSLALKFYIFINFGLISART